MKKIICWFFFIYLLLLTLISVSNLTVFSSFLLILGLYVVFFRNTLFKESSSQIDLYKKPYTLVKENKHGHRCYLEGLTHSERDVVNILASSLDSKKYFIFNNLILQTPNGGSTQIDHLVVSIYGVFIIESKDMSGWIFGSQTQKMWTQSLPSAIKYQFQNPLHQNYGHVCCLNEYIPNIQKDKLFSIVTFSNRSEFKTELPKNVIHQDYLGSYIKSFSPLVFSEQEMMFIIGKISYLCQAVDISVEKHIQNVREAVMAKSLKENIKNS